MNWTQSIDSLLDKIRFNFIQPTNRHIQNHLYYKGCSVYFEIPTIILSVFAGSFAVGADPFAEQETICVINCSISMVITILTSIKLCMKIGENQQQEQELAIQFKALALYIFETVSLPYEDRGTDGIDYLNKIYNKYINLVEGSTILNKILSILNKINKKDNILVIDPKLLDDGSSINSNNSNPITTEENEL